MSFWLWFLCSNHPPTARVNATRASTRAVSFGIRTHTQRPDFKAVKKIRSSKEEEKGPAGGWVLLVGAIVVGGVGAGWLEAGGVQGDPEC